MYRNVSFTWIVKSYPHFLDIVSLLSQLLSQSSRNVFHFVEIMQENFLHDKSMAAFIVTEYKTLHIQGTITLAPHMIRPDHYHLFSRNKSQT